MCRRRGLLRREFGPTPYRPTALEVRQDCLGRRPDVVRRTVVREDGRARARRPTRVSRTAVDHPTGGAPRTRSSEQ